MTDVVTAFLEAASGSDRMCWLDGGGARAWSGQRSILGVLAADDVSLTYDAGSREVRRHQGTTGVIVGDDIFSVLEEEIAKDAGNPSISWVGYFGYAARADLPARPASGVPDAVWMRVPEPLYVEHDRVQEAEPGLLSPAPARQPEVRVPDEYAEAFTEVRRQLHLGNTYEVNLTYRERIDAPVDPVTAYLRLRAINPAPYAGFLRHGDVRVLSSSPERFATVDRHRRLETKPIKGTTTRGADPAADEAASRHLASDPRYRAENLMIVDLLRNDLSMVCEVGSVEVPALMQVESYPSVHQLVSTVRGRLRPEISTIGALRALFPAGSMTGAPKLRTMQIIDQEESSARGVYAGAFGWISADGRADLGVVIRTLVAVPHDGAWRYEYGTGGGITVRSDLVSEYAETRWKAERLRAAVLSP